MDAFPLEVHSSLKWYVYRLIDPRNGNTFYVGKRQGNRVFEHTNGSLQGEDVDQNESGIMSLKNGVIQDIQRAGLTVLEAALIDAYPGLANLVGGHGNSICGCRSVEQITSAYAAAPLLVRESLILIFIGKSLDEGRDIYDSVRAVWRMFRTKQKSTWQKSLAFALGSDLMRPQPS